MKKKLLYNSSVIFALLFFLITLTSCYGKNDIEKTRISNITSESTTKNDTPIPINDLYKIGVYTLYSTKQLPNNTLLLCYLDQTSNVCQFRIYNLIDNTILSTSKALTFDRFCLKTLTSLTEYFYLISNQTCCVFNFNCELIKEIDLPIEIPPNSLEQRFWLSNDLEKMVYVDNPDSKAEYLYVIDTNNQNKKQLQKLGEGLTITDLFFSLNSKRLGFEGVTIPDGQTTSVGCYGYIDLETFKTTMFIDDRIFITHNGDYMLVQYKTADYGIERNGIVKTLNLSTSEKKEQKMFFNDECENATISSNGDYLVGMHKDYKNKSVIFNVYYKGEKIKAISYKCLPEKNFWDFISVGTEIMLDIETKQILVFYYDNDKMGYSIMSFDF